MLKKLVGSLLVVAMVFGLFGTTLSAEAKGSNCRTTNYRNNNQVKERSGPKLYMNGGQVNFKKNYGYPFIDRANRTQIPFRAFSESCKFNVSWDGNNRVGYAKKGNMTVGIPVDKDYITVNGKVVKSDTKNIIIDGRIHLPLRVVLESFGYNVKWDNGCIYVTTGDKEQPKNPTDDQDTPSDQNDKNNGGNKPDDTGDPSDSGNTDDQKEPNNQTDGQDKPVEVSEEALRGIHIGDDASKVTGTLGKPNATAASGNGFTWYIYNSDYKKYVQIGMKDNKVVALYSNASYWALTESVRYGASANTVKSAFGAKADYSGMLQATKGKINYKFYVDKYDQNKVVAVLMEDTGVKRNSYYATGSDALRTSYEQQVFELTNVERVNKGLQPFIMKEDVASVSRMHSKDMSEKNYFAHNNLQGEAPWDRAKKAGISYSYYGENIAMGQKDALSVVNGWMNSSGHRKNILSKNYSGLGVGVWFKSDNTPYYTQNFIK